MVQAIEKSSHESQIDIIGDVEEREITLQKLHVAAMEGNWGVARKILEEDSEAKVAKLSSLGMTALHVAASCGRSGFVVELVKLLEPEQLELRDQLGRTALHHVALAADESAAKAMVDKNGRLPQLGDMDSLAPLFYAARWRHPSKSKKMLEYLYQVTRDEAPCYVYTSASASNLIVGISTTRCHDTALNILKEYPDLALTRNDNGMSVLHILATQPSVFEIGTKLLHPMMICPWRRNQGIAKKQKERKEALELVHFIFKMLQRRPKSEVLNFFLPPDSQAILHLAAVHGVFELIKVCLNYFPDLIWYANNEGKLLLHVAIESRRLRIFNHIINLIGENTKAYADGEIEGKNNILHLAAKMAPSPQLYSIHHGPAFQMQRELQWYKAVEELVYDEIRVAKNSENKTPKDLFLDQHKDLMKDARDWLKDTSSSCMVVATLVATVAFAAMITAPGGNDKDGKPVNSKNKLFLVFSISDAVSMVSSAISLLMFLSVQTTRYTVDDILEKLPNKLLKGLLSLCVAVSTMMLAFGAAIALSLHKKLNWAQVAIIVAACFPVIIFSRLQLPLLVQTFIFTSGHGIFKGLRDPKLGGIKKFVYRLLLHHTHWYL